MTSPSVPGLSAFSAGIVSLDPSPGSSRVVDLLRGIVSHYIALSTDSSDSKAEDPRPTTTASRRFRTDYFYNGEHNTALLPDWVRWLKGEKHDPNLELKRLMIALVDRIASIDFSLGNAFLHDLSEELENAHTDSSAIEALHKLYEMLAIQEYKLLKAAADQSVKDLLQQYPCECEDDLKKYIELILIGEDMEAEKSALKELYEEEKADAASLKKKFSNLDEKLKKEKNRLKNQWKGKIAIGKLTYDALYFAKKMNDYKSSLDEQLRNYKKDINRLSQEMKVNKGLKKRDINRLKEEANGILSYETHFVPLYESQNATSELPQKKQNKREIQKKNQTLSVVVGILLGIGEGVVAACTITNPFLFALVFVAGFYCNYLLVKRDTFDVVNLIRLNKLYYDKEGNPLAPGVKFVVNFFGLFLSFGGAFAYASLSAFKLQGLLSGLLLHLLPTVFASGMAIVLTAPVLIATSLGLGAIFFVVIANFIKEKQWKAIGFYFQKEWFLSAELREEMTLLDWLKHIADVLFIKLPKLVVGIGLAMIITVASYGVFHQTGVQLLSFIVNNSLANYISHFFISMNAIVTLVFGIEKNLKGIDSLSASSPFLGPLKILLELVLFPVGLVEMIVRCTLLAWVVEEYAAAKTANFLAACNAGLDSLAAWVETVLPEWLQYRPTYCNLKKTSSPLQKKTTGLSGVHQTYCNVINLMKASAQANGGGQIALFVIDPNGANVLKPVLGGGAQPMVGVAQYANSCVPNIEAMKGDADQRRKDLPDLRFNRSVVAPNR
ncbi:MAG: hypothetical protein K0S27_1788 [Gammaproteobacteria bacterium]|jgi:hypothetical protein|nr:hypothetical protein [Gammaproteobacteria bacterium]